MLQLLRGPLGLSLLAMLATHVHADDASLSQGLVGYWKLAGDCQDSSGEGHHAINHGVELADGAFDGRIAYLEVPDCPEMHFGRGDFSISADVYTQSILNDIVGDLVTKYDPAGHKGFNLTINASNPGYNAHGNACHLFFGVDDDRPGKWTDCGRPGGRTHISDALTVFRGELYVGTTDGDTESDWAHVYRYGGSQQWQDCGRLGAGKTRGVYAMVVHDGELYAATSASHGGQPATMDFGRVYRYRGGQKWEDLGQPGANYRLNALASFQGKLYVAGFNIGPDPGHVYVFDGGQWKACGEFKGWPHTLAVHDGRLFTAYPQGEVFAYDGQQWQGLGNPLGSHAECNQIHALGVYRGELFMGSWPKGKVAVLRDGRWVDLGRLGDATEVIALTVYNGSLFAGTIPRAEVFRFDQPNRWTSVRRLFDPPDFDPVPVGSGAKGVEDWTRASSLAVFQGQLFVSTATCYRTKLAALPDGDVRGRVFALSVGAGVSYDTSLDTGWSRVAAVRQGRDLKLYVNGKLVATRSSDDEIDVSNNSPLQIGFGPQSHLHGKLREVRLYRRALTDAEVMTLARRAK